MFGGRKSIEIEWRQVPGFDKYEVSSDGRVRSFYYAGKELKPYTHKWGHQEVRLRRDKKSHSRTIGVIVAEAFIGPRPIGLDVCHNDGDAGNNRVENLRYDTRSANIFDAVHHGTHVHSRKTHCKNGHEFDEENTRLSSRGRICRACHREDERVRRAKHSRN